MTPYFQQDGVTLYHGDNVQTMREAIPDASIDLVVTSPPYDNLRTYGGHTWDFEGLAAELWRAIKPGGVMVWIVNDATVDGSETGTSFRQALRFKDLGFRLHDTMIYHRQAANPSNTAGRYWQNFEYMFVVSKGQPITANLLRDRKNINRQMGGDAVRQKSGKVVKGNRGGIEFGEFGYRENIWKYNAGGGLMGDNGEHPATFPEALARDHILSWSNEGDTVLDPFSGSGTTLKMSRLMGRKGIGIEIHQDYCDIAVERLRQKLLF